MQKTGTRCFITFPSTYHVLQAEKIFREHRLNFVIVPIPRELTSSCGMAILIAGTEKKSFEDVISCEGITFEAFHNLENQPSSLWNMGVSHK